MAMKHPVRAPLPLATVAFSASILAVFAVELAGDGAELCARFGFVPARPTFGAALASLFLHDPSGLAHVGGNLVFLVVFGGIVERAFGSLRFLAVFITTGLAGAAMHILVDPNSTTPLVGCSGALFGLLALAGVLRPRLLGFVVAFVAVNIWHAFSNPNSEGISFACHLGGFASGTALVMLARLRGVDLCQWPRAARATA